MDALQPGDIVDDRYEIVGLLGQGGMGIVYKANEYGLNRIVALKMISLLSAPDAEVHDRLKREGLILASLNHKNLLVVYRFGIAGGCNPYIAMELLNGISLRELLSSGGPLAPSRALEIAAAVCEGMEYAHNRGVIHRDLKPENIMLTDEPAGNVVKVVDFGLARVLSGSDGSMQRITQTGALMGTTYYMSPEQFMGKPADARSDVYSLGCILYECLEGAPPFRGESPLHLMQQHCLQPTPDVRSQPLPQGLMNAINRALSKDPELRYQTMSEFARDLQLVAQSDGDEVPAPKPAGSSDTKGQRGLLAAVIGIVFVLFCAGLALKRTKDPIGQQSSSSVPRIASQSYRLTSDPAQTLVIQMQKLKREPHTKELFERASSVSTDAMHKISDNDKALKFQSNMVLCQIHHSQGLELKLGARKDPVLERFAYSRARSAGLQALEFARRPDGSYHRPAAAAFEVLASLAAEQEDITQERQYLEKALQVVREPRDDSQFVVLESLPGFDTGELRSWITRQVARCAVRDGDWNRAQALLEDNAVRTHAEFGFLSINEVMTAAELACIYHELHKFPEARRVTTDLVISLQREYKQELLKPHDMLTYLPIAAEMALLHVDTDEAFKLTAENVYYLDGNSDSGRFGDCAALLDKLDCAAQVQHRNDLLPKLAALRTRVNYLRNRR